MRSYVVKGCLTLCLFMLGTAMAQPRSVDPADVEGLQRSFKGPAATETPTVYKGEDGFVRFLGAPPQGYFEAVTGGAKALSPEDTAKSFVTTHSGAFGVDDTGVGFTTKNVKELQGSDYVRLDQTFNGIEVFGAQIVVQLKGGNVLNVMNDTMTQTGVLSSGDVSTAPTINAAAAVAAAQRDLADELGNVSAAQLKPSGMTKLLILNPSVIGGEGATRLVWHDVLSATDAGIDVAEAVFVDAHSGELALHYSLLEHALQRTIYDALSSDDDPVRTEGQPASGDEDVDNAYDYLGDTYNFYFTEHQRDGLDGEGSPLVATVNFSFYNAFYNPSNDEMFFGNGFVLDDVTGHELTHGVTANTSDLIYAGFSGAINESFSDIWGEFIDLSNGRGNDSPEVRWLIAEELSPEILEAFGLGTPVPGLRSMKDPTLLGDPDRLSSPLIKDPSPFAADGGGVHGNSGIGNKLAYLLTDGDTFNNQTVGGFGISRTADLFYETQFLLSESADYYDLYLALAGAAIGQGFSFADRINLDNAARAVEIVPPGLAFQGLRDFRATSTFTTDNDPVIALTWTNPPEDAFSEVILLRNVLEFATAPDQGTEIYRGREDKFLDTGVQDDIEYFYTLISEVTVDPEWVGQDDVPDGARVIQIRYAKATAGETPSLVLSEAFGIDPALGLNNPMDLQYTQILFEPIGAPPLTEPGILPGGGSYGDYEVVIKKNVTQLPVVRDDGTESSYLINLLEDGYVPIALEGSVTFPFFNKNYSTIFVYTNGYISFEIPIPSDNELNFPNIATQFAIPRISALFADLAPLIGGDMWIRSLPDRLAITYENLPEWRVNAPFGNGGTNTVQVELFTSGHIRFTYLALDVENALVGLSDGNGIPRNPFLEFDDLIPFSNLIDFSEAPTIHTALSIDPIAAVFAEAGERITFTVTTTTAEFEDGTPTLTAVWDRDEPTPFGYNGNGTGTFDWQTEAGDEGDFTVRVLARLGAVEVFQDVRINVGNSNLKPEARNMQLATDNPAEDPTADRTVPTEATLFASYDYFHPLMATNPTLYAEGDSLLYWFRNGQVVPSLTGRFTVQASMTEGGDRWQFRVIPVTKNGVDGPQAISPMVTIIGSPDVTSITPSFGTYNGGTTVRIKGTRLSGALVVKFGGVAAVNVRAISDTELEAVTPQHPIGTVDVSVESTLGVGLFRNGFSYIDPAQILLPTDVNGDGKVDSIDVQLVINAVLQSEPVKSGVNPDANRDGNVNAIDLQAVVNGAIGR